VDLEGKMSEFVDKFYES